MTMFQVRHKGTGKIYTVYSVSRQSKQEFLIYCQKWMWVDAEKYEPLFVAQNG